MAWDVPLRGLTISDINQVMLHPEQQRNLSVINGLLNALDDSRTLEDLFDVQAGLFRYSYRAQLAAHIVGRALSRVKSHKPADWAGAQGDDAQQFVTPPWRLVCDQGSQDPGAWLLERRVAERVIRQLRSVGDALAWRIHRHDRRVIIALSANDPAGPFVGKKGLDSEMARINEVRARGNFGFMHDLTSVIRILDVTEVDARGARTLHEVKASDTISAHAKWKKQVRKAERLLAAVDGRLPLPGEDEIILWRAETQLRTRARDAASLLSLAEQRGHASMRLGDRVVGALYFPTILKLNQPKEQLWDTYASRRDRLLGQHQEAHAGLHRLKLSSGDTAAREPALVPWGLYPWTAHQRAALICDYLVLEVVSTLDQVADRFRRRGYRVEVQIRPDEPPLDRSKGILAVFDHQSGMTLHVAAVQQLLLEFIDTRCFVDASLEILQTPDRGRPQRSLMVYSNEQACWR